MLNAINFDGMISTVETQLQSVEKEVVYSSFRHRNRQTDRQTEGERRYLRKGNKLV